MEHTIVVAETTDSPTTLQYQELCGVVKSFLLFATD